LEAPALVPELAVQALALESVASVPVLGLVASAPALESVALALVLGLVASALALELVDAAEAPELEEPAGVMVALAR